MFKPFKHHFREYRDFWISRNLNQAATKQILAQWVALSLKKALSVSNIQNGFSGTGIFPFNRGALTRYFAVPAMHEGGGAAFASQQGGWSGQHHPEPHAQALASEPQHAVSTEQVHQLHAVSTQQVHASSTGVDNENLEQGGCGTSMASAVLLAELEADLGRAPSIETQHYFIDVDNENPYLRDEAAGLDPAIMEPQSLTRFLTLPTVTARINPKKRDPIVNFAKSVILTSNQYIEAAHQMRTRREEAATTKERNKEERVESRKRKAAEKEEATARRAIEREESRRLKEQKAHERVEAQARKAAEKEEALRVRAVKAAELAATRAAKAVEKAARAVQKHQLTQHCNTRSMQSAQGRQAGA